MSLRKRLIDLILFAYKMDGFKLVINYNHKEKGFDPKEKLFSPMMCMINDLEADFTIRGVLCEEVLGYLSDKQLLEVHERAVRHEIDSDFKEEKVR